jgi:phenylalanyl-tRNA synthetase beta chain
MSAIFDKEFITPASDKKLIGAQLTVKIEDENVLAYHLVRIENVPVSAPNFGMKTLLQKSGLTAKFDLVDITNIVMTELGQPMHVFDADKISGNITVRSAKDGEEMIALNGETYKLANGDVVIADDREVLAIAGIIGGMSSAVSETTRNICFESACFDAAAVRQTSTRIGLRTDALMRFEKSLDPLLAETAMNRAIEMLAFLGKK